MSFLRLFAYLLVFVLVSCSKDDDDDPSNPAPGGSVKITSLSDEYVFWGDELTINGSGFSNVKEENVITFLGAYPVPPGLNFTSAGGDIEILSATATQLKIRIPYKTEQTAINPSLEGLERAMIEVKVKDARDTSDLTYFVGLPRVGTFIYHYGWYDLGGVARSGDSVIIDGGFYGSTINAIQSGYYDKLRLKIDGLDVPIKRRKISNSIQGWAMYLSSKDFSEINCAEGDNGWNDRAMNFEFHVEGKDLKGSRTLHVTYNPEYNVESATGPQFVSKSAGGTPTWYVEGDDMYFSHAVFYSTCQGIPNAEFEIATPGTINSEYQVGVPLAVLVEGCAYKIYLKTPCDESKLIGQVTIQP